MELELPKLVLHGRTLIFTSDEIDKLAGALHHGGLG
jgi:hypothetical protein